MAPATPCPRCSGTGQVLEATSLVECRACGGSGRMSRRNRVIARFAETPSDARLAADSLAAEHGLSRRVSTSAMDGFEWNSRLVLYVETNEALKARITAVRYEKAASRGSTPLGR